MPKILYYPVTELLNNNLPEGFSTKPLAPLVLSDSQLNLTHSASGVFKKCVFKK